MSNSVIKKKLSNLNKKIRDDRARLGEVQAQPSERLATCLEILKYKSRVNLMIQIKTTRNLMIQIKSIRKNVIRLFRNN